MSGHHKVPFTDDDDALLMKYIATYNPQPKGRLGMKLYERLVENAEGKWSFASRHPVHSWRERYKTNQRLFDAKILRYQKKHGISADAPSPVAGQSSATKKHAFGSPTSPSRNSPPLAGGSGSKKRAREINATHSDLDSSPTKKLRRASPSPHSVLPLVKPQSKGKLRVELSPSPRYEEDRDLTVVGPDDYVGALSGESDQGGEESQSDEGSSSPFPPSSPTKKTRSKPSANTKKNHARVGASTAPEELTQPLASSSRQQHSPEHSAAATRPSTSKTSSPVCKLVIPPPQLSQGPTPPHTSALSSPSPLARGNSHTPSPPSQSGTVHRPQLVASPKQRRPRPIKRRIVREEEDDIFGTPPVQSPPSSPPPQTRARDAPRLVEGPYRSAYTRANGGQRASGGVRQEEEINGNEWPPRSKQDVPMSSPERPTAADVDRASVQHIDLRVLHSRKSVETFRAGSTPSLGGSTSRPRTVEKKQPRQARAPRSSTPPNLSESNKELVLALGLEEVYKRMAENHKFHIDIVREVAARQRSLEHADQVLRNMREAAEQEYARLLKQEFGTGAHQTEESDEGEEEENVEENLGNDEPDQGPSALSQPASPYSNHSLPDLSMADGGRYMEEDADGAQELDNVPTMQADSSLPGSSALPNVEWTDEDDELLLDGDLVVHKELAKRKGLGSVKFRTAHLYSLLLDG